MPQSHQIKSNRHATDKMKSNGLASVRIPLLSVSYAGFEVLAQRYRLESVLSFGKF